MPAWSHPPLLGAWLPYHPPMVPSGVPEGGPLTRGEGTEVPGPSFLGVGAGGRHRCSCVPVRSVAGVVPSWLPVLLAFFCRHRGTACARSAAPGWQCVCRPGALRTAQIVLSTRIVRLAGAMQLLLSAPCGVIPKKIIFRTRVFPCQIHWAGVWDRFG